MEQLAPYLDAGLVVLSPTRGELAARCHRRHLLSDRLHLRPRVADKSPALTFGGSVHVARDAFWEEATDPDGYELPERRPRALEAAQEAFRSHYPDPGLDYHTVDLGMLLLAEYAKNAKLGGVVPGDWKILHREQRFHYDLPLSDSATLRIYYTIDTLLENAEGELCIMDLKTASKLSGLWRASQTNAIQIRAYKALEEARLGRPISYVQVEGLQKKDDSGRMEYVWADASWTPSYVSEALQLLKGIGLADFRFLSTAGGSFDSALAAALTNPALATFNQMDCKSYYYTCPFYDLCYSDPELRIGLALSDYEVDVQDYLDQGAD